MSTVRLPWILALVVGVLMTSCNLGMAHGEPGTLSAILATHTMYAQDEFTEALNSPPNPNLWNIETGVGWGNDEAQTYTADARNIRQDGEGNLVIEADNKDGRVTSARINTDAKEVLTNGLITARIKMPAGQGVHSAFWMLGQSMEDVGWPACGEIDIIETLNEGATGYFTIHGQDVKLESSKHFTDLVDNFHTYWLFKQPQKLTIGIDEQPMATFSPADLPEGAPWVYDQPFFALLNVAVGGEWPGPLAPDVLPKQMIVDWVRFYQ